MSLYIGDQQIKNVTFTVNRTNTVSQSQLMLDVTTIGIVANNKNVSAREWYAAGTVGYGFLAIFIGAFLSVLVILFSEIAEVTSWIDAFTDSDIPDICVDISEMNSPSWLYFFATSP